MPTYVMLTRLAPGSIDSPQALEALERKVMNRVRRDCGNVSWGASYAVLGPADYVDVFEAPDNETAAKVSALVRAFGHATTEIWPATPWPRFKEMIRGLGPAKA